ncbi:hypothetical protein FHR33_000503 [Nonomuraea dietziae]|uniref:Uncharacterized protein n=1 Tax=Nonomuraea dietziae TaxID=65515 RepID=A0A7W5Y8K4_9ACTN|nr:hypothetical protein [Nonomuraea dietziae]
MSSLRTARGPRFGGQQFHLGTGVVQHVLGDRMTFGLIGVQQGFRRPAADLCGQFPAEVERVLNAQVEALPADGWMDVRRIAGQEHPPDAITFGQPGGIPEAGQPARGVHAEIGSGDGAQLLFEIVEGGWFGAVADSRGGDYDAVDPFAEGPEPESLMGLADFGYLGGDLLLRHTHVHLAHERVGP